MAIANQKLNKFHDDELIIGSHVKMKADNYLIGSIKETVDQGANSFMIFLGSPRKAELKEFSDDEIKSFHEEMNKSKLDLKNIAVHFPYILNPSSPNVESRLFASEFFDKELSLMEKLNISLCCFHPGSSKGADRFISMKNMVETLYPVFKKHPKVKIAIETMSGKGNENNVGLYESKFLMNCFENLNNVGICIDTCHLWDSGFDISNIEAFKNIIDETITFNKIFLIHLNDSLNARGSSKDRHANIGKGFIGFNALIKICLMKELKNVPKILETPLIVGNEHKDEISTIKSMYIGKYL